MKAIFERNYAGKNHTVEVEVQREYKKGDIVDLHLDSKNELAGLWQIVGVRHDIYEYTNETPNCTRYFLDNLGER